MLRCKEQAWWCCGLHCHTVLDTRVQAACCTCPECHLTRSHFNGLSCDKPFYFPVEMPYLCLRTFRQPLPQNEHTYKYKHKHISDQMFRNKVLATSWIQLEYLNITPSWYFSFPCYCGSNMAAARPAASWQFGEQIISSREVLRTAMLTLVCSTFVQRRNTEEWRKHNVATVWLRCNNWRRDVINMGERERERLAGSTQCP